MIIISAIAVMLHKPVWLNIVIPISVMKCISYTFTVLVWNKSCKTIKYH